MESPTCDVIMEHLASANDSSAAGLANHVEALHSGSNFCAEN